MGSKQQERKEREGSEGGREGERQTSVMRSISVTGMSHSVFSHQRSMWQGHPIQVTSPPSSLPLIVPCFEVPRTIPNAASDAMPLDRRRDGGTERRTAAFGSLPTLVWFPPVASSTSPLPSLRPSVGGRLVQRAPLVCTAIRVCHSLIRSRLDLCLRSSRTLACPPVIIPTCLCC